MTAALPRPPARSPGAPGRRPAVSLADLIRAAGVLEADAAVVARVADLLGLRAPAAPPAPVSTPVTPPLPPVTLPAVPGARPPLEEPGRMLPAAEDPRPPRRPRLVAAPALPPAPPRPLRGTVQDLLPAPPAAGRRPPEPLLSPAHQRAVLSALVAVPRPGPEVDVTELIDRLASRQPIWTVPRLPAATTRLGVQLLLDQGPSMGPYLRDLRLLADALRQVAGAGAVEVLAADGDLAEVQPLADDAEPLSDDAGPRPYTTPIGPRPVLVASDLGAGRAVGAVPPARWLELARQAREAGCPLVVLVPYPPARWPDWVAGQLTLVHWDRPTDTREARRAALRAAALAGVRQ